MTAVSVKAPLTPKADKTPHIVKLKVFWKTTKQWTAADIADFQKSVPALAEKIKAEKYWNKDGDIKTSKFTCEDFAIRILAQYASSKGLPVKLKTGVRVYRNMELYDAAEHDKYSSTMYGFGDMVMLTYGARDTQRIGESTVAVAKPEDLLPGDILGLAHDIKGQVTGGRAHHIQIVATTYPGKIDIYQGNSEDTIHWPVTWINRLLRRNVADPQQQAYAGTLIETGRYIHKSKQQWDYVNNAVSWVS
jgi:hypothetical protein